MLWYPTLRSTTPRTKTCPRGARQREGWGTVLLCSQAVFLTHCTVDYFAVGVDKRKAERHLAEGMGGAAEAGIEGADHGFYAVESAFGELAVLYVGFGGLKNALVHGVVVVAGGYDQVGPGDFAVLVHFVVVIEGAARGFDLARAFKAVDAGGGADVLVEDAGIGENAARSSRCRGELQRDGRDDSRTSSRRGRLPTA